MTEAEWRVWENPEKMLDLVPYRVSKRKWRLMAVAFCRRIWPLLSERSKQAVEAAESWADGLVRLRDLRQAQDAVPVPRINSVGGKFIDGADGAAFSAASPSKGGAISSARLARRALEAAGGSIDREMSYQCDLIRDVVGNPYRPSPPFPHAILAWNDGTVRRIAEAIYEERQMPEGALDPACLAILADALLDAGCEDEELIRHCRSAGPHVRGCWAIDLILGKE